LGNIELGRDVTSFTRLSRESLEVERDYIENTHLFSLLFRYDYYANLTTSLLGFLLLLGVGNNTIQEFLTALGVLDVFNTDVDTLLQITVTNVLVNEDTDSRLGDVVDDTSATIDMDLVHLKKKITLQIPFFAYPW
jgi:hypothetical protein